MTRSELVEALTRKQSHLDGQDVELSVERMLEHMSQALAGGERIEIRGFGSFSLHFRHPRMGRNPKTGESVALAGRHVPHFKPGKAAGSGQWGSGHLRTTAMTGPTAIPQRAAARRRSRQCLVRR